MNALCSKIKLFHNESLKGRIQPESLTGVANFIVLYKPVKLFANKRYFSAFWCTIWYQTVGLVLMHTYVLETCLGDIGFKSYRRNTQVSAVPFGGHVNVITFDCEVVET